MDPLYKDPCMLYSNIINLYIRRIAVCSCIVLYVAYTVDDRSYSMMHGLTDVSSSSGGV